MIAKVFHNKKVNETTLHASDGAEAPGVKDVWDLNHHALCMMQDAFSCSKMQMWIFVSAWNVYVQSIVAHICNCHFCCGL